MDDGGTDFGILTGVGLVIASAVILLFVFSLLRSTAPANTSVALEAAASEVSGDVETVAAMAIPYRAERYYGFNGVNVSVSADRVVASAEGETFSRPLVGRIVPGEYEENGSPSWNGTEEMRERLNVSFNATGTRECPIGDGWSPELTRLMDGAGRSTLLHPVEVLPGRPFVIEKIFIYTYNASTRVLEAKPYVLVYPG